MHSFGILFANYTVSKTYRPGTGRRKLGRIREILQGFANVRKTMGKPSRTEETEKSKGSVMTVQVHPVETEGRLRPEKQKPAMERKQSDPNMINLWDECADVGDVTVRLRDRRNDKEKTAEQK